MSFWILNFAFAGTVLVLVSFFLDSSFGLLLAGFCCCVALTFCLRLLMVC